MARDVIRDAERNEAPSKDARAATNNARVIPLRLPPSTARMRTRATTARRMSTPSPAHWRFIPGTIPELIDALALGQDALLRSDDGHVFVASACEGPASVRRFLLVNAWSGLAAWCDEDELGSGAWLRHFGVQGRLREVLIRCAGEDSPTAQAQRR